MTPEEPKSEKLYKAIKDIDATKAANLVNKYEQVMAGISDALTTSTNHGAKQAKVHIDNAAEGIIKNSGEFEKSSYEKDRAHLLDSFRQELDNVADYLGMNLQEKPPTKGRLPKERPVGFAEPFKESYLQEAWDNLDSRQKAAVFNELSKSFVENLEITPVQQARWEQFNIIITALRTMKTEIDESRTKAEDWNQIWEYDETTHERAKDIDSLIANATRFGMKGILQEGLSVDQTLLKYNLEFGDALKDKLQHYDETKAFMDKYGKVKDITNEKDKIAYYVDLIKFMRDRKDYGTAQMLMEELMEKEFDQGREILGELEESEVDKDGNIFVITKKTKIYDEAYAKINKKITADVLAQWRKEGMNTEQIEETRKEIIATEARKLENDYIAQNILIGEVGEAKSGIKSIFVGAQHKPIWGQYKKMLDVKDEWLTVADKNWDYILDELIITAPLIVLSGGVAGLAMKGIAAGARLAIAGTRLATVGVRLAEGGRLARAAYSAGKLSVRATSLITEGALFELTHMGIQGKFLLNQDEWVKQVLWTAATLGVFKKAGEIGTKAGGITQDLLKAAMPKLADKKLVALMNHLIVKGHFEVAGMLLIGATQHMAAGELDEFMDNFGEQLFHAYVSVGALNVVGGVVSVGKKKIFQSGEKPKTTERKYPVKAEKPKSVIQRVESVIDSKQSASVEISSARDYNNVVSSLDARGFKFKFNEKGDLIAEKGGVEIHLKETGSLAKSRDAWEKKMNKSEMSLDVKSRKIFEGLKRDSAKLVTDILKLSEKGPLSSAVRVQFIARLSALGTSIAILFKPGVAKANPLDWVKEKFDVVGDKVDVVTDGIGNFANEVGSAIHGGISLALILGLGYGTTRAWGSMSRVWGALRLPSLPGLYARGKFTDIADRMSEKTGTFPNDIATRNAGGALRNVMAGRYLGHEIATGMREGRYKFGSLNRLAGDLIERGNRILDILSHTYSATDPFPQAELNDNMRLFNEHVTDFRNRLEVKSSRDVKFGWNDVPILVGYYMLVHLSAYWFFGGTQKEDEKNDGDGFGPAPSGAPSQGGFGPAPSGAPSQGGFGPAPSGAPNTPREGAEFPVNLKDKGFFRGPTGELLRKGNSGTYEILNNNAVVYTHTDGKMKLLAPGDDPDLAKNWSDYVPKKPAPSGVAGKKVDIVPSTNKEGSAAEKAAAEKAAAEKAAAEKAKPRPRKMPPI